MREWMRSYRLVAKERINQPRRERHKAHPEHKLLQHARTRTKKHRLPPCNLTLDDVKVPTHCPVLGIPLAVNSGRKGPADHSPTLDRIYPHKGYVKGNVIVVSFLANRIKTNATVRQLEQVAKFYKRLIQKRENSTYRR